MKFTILLIAYSKLILWFLSSQFQNCFPFILGVLTTPPTLPLNPSTSPYYFFQSMIHLVFHLTFWKWVAESLHGAQTVCAGVCHSLSDCHQGATWGIVSALNGSSFMQHLQSTDSLQHISFIKHQVPIKLCKCQVMTHESVFCKVINDSDGNRRCLLNWGGN